MKTSIIILTYNKLEYTKQCIESIRKYTNSGTYEIIVVDNYSTDDTRLWLSEQNDIKVILNESNLGFPRGCNQGMEIAEGNYLLLLNNDTIVTENWLDNMLICLNSDDSIGAVSCSTNNCSYAQTIEVNYRDLNEMQIFAENYNVSDSTKWEERLKLIGFCFLIKRNVVEQIGLLDERFSPGNFEDDDYSLRIRQAGYKLMLCNDTFIHHFGSTSFRDNKKSYSTLLETNAKKFKDKWGFDPVYSQHIRFEIVNMMDSDPLGQINVLEIGCACGGTLLNIKHRFVNSRLFGIELNGAAASVASLIADVRNYDIEKDIIDFPEEMFDYIILADVVEHLYNPWKVLENLKRYLKPKGKVLLSIPNVMHHSVMNELLEGSWAYKDAGIMDWTHIRFFTLREIKKLLLETGYYKLDIAAKTLSGINDKMLTRQLAGIVKPEVYEQFNIYQYLVCATKHGLEETFDLIRSDQQDNGLIIENLAAHSIEDIIEVVLNLKLETDNKLDLLNKIGIVHFQMEVYDKVLPFFENAYHLDNNNVEVLYNISYFLCSLGAEDSASIFIDRLKQVNLEAYQQLIDNLNSIG